VVRPGRWTRGVALVVVLVSVYLGTASVEQAAAQTPGEETLWPRNDPRRDGYRICREIVESTIRGVNLDASSLALQRPDGITPLHWVAAVDGNHPRGWPYNQFSYRPRCDLLLPDDYASRISIRYASEVFTRCQARISGGRDQDPDREGDQHDLRLRRPPVVPEWYWGVSMRSGHCDLLLPLGAFGLGEDDNDWSGWSSDEEEPYLDPHAEGVPERITRVYDQCVQFIDWRMTHGAAWDPNDGPLGEEYGQPVGNAVPLRLWYEATGMWKAEDIDDALTADVLWPDETDPTNWFPNCQVLLAQVQCLPDDASLIPDSCVGGRRTSQYDIGYAEYEDEPLAGVSDPEITDFSNVNRNMWGGPTGFAYWLGKGAIQIARWSTDWAFTFDISRYNPLAMAMGGSYQDALDGPIGSRLQEVFWLVLVAWAGWAALSGRLSMAGAEILLTVVMLLLSGTLIAQRELYMDATWNLMNKASGAVLVAGMGQSPDDDSASNRQEILDDLHENILRVFVREPYDHLNWGRSLGDARDPNNPLRACANSRDYILSRGPHGTDPWPRQEMRRAGNGQCAELADFNAEPSGTRLLGALLVMASSILVAVLLILLGLTIVVGKLLALLLFAVAPLAALVTILPGAGRRLAWSWLTSLMQAVIAVVAMSFLLSLLMLAVDGLLTRTSEVHMIETFFTLNLLVLIVMSTRRSVLRSAQRFAGRLGEYLSTTRGSGGSWASAAAAAGGNRGLDLLHVDRAVWGAGVAAGWAGRAAAGWTARAAIRPVTRTIGTRWQERRMAGRSYRNLQRVSEWKRSQNYRNAQRRPAWNERHPDRPYPEELMDLP
jgi:hypothetical protein